MCPISLLLIQLELQTMCVSGWLYIVVVLFVFAVDCKESDDCCNADAGMLYSGQCLEVAAVRL